MEEEKETEEEGEKEKEPHHIPVEHQELPIMHWEELSQRIAELEKQEQERREKRRTGQRTEDRWGGDWRDVWEEDDEDVRRGRVAVAASRLNSHRNLQLCFINNSDSEEEEEEGAGRKVSMGAGHDGCHGSGLKQEVAAALRALRDELLAEQKEQEESQAGCSCVAQRKHLERRELQDLCLQQLGGLRASLQQEVHGTVRAGSEPGQSRF